jgi:general secretion pathway protein D
MIPLCVFACERLLRTRRLAALGAGLVLVLALSGCAQQRIRDDSQVLLRAGAYEQAVSGLEAGLGEYPQSAVLRAGLIAARSEAFTRLLAEAAAARASGRYADAENALTRAKPFDLSGTRADELLGDLMIEGRQRKSIDEAQALIAKQQPDAARRIVAEALKDNARQPELQAMQRRLDAQLREQQLAGASTGLAESRPISLDFRDASLRTVLDVVTRNSGVNFIFDKDMHTDARITVFLRSAAVEDAIDLIINTHGLAKKLIDAQTILIYPNTPEKQREHQEQVVRVFYLASAEAKGAAAFLRSMLRVRDPYVDDRSNMLALRESPETIALAERLIALYDSPEPEVLLEVEVIEVRSTRLTELGVKFPDAFSFELLPQAGASSLTLDSFRGITRDRIGVGVGGLLVNFKREVGDFNTLANPRIRAKNKEKAKILIGDKLPIVTSITGQGGFVSDSVSYVDVGLKLEVEPTVYADDEVAIRVNLEVSSLSREVRTRSGTLAYQIGTRNAATMLRLRDGETQLLAGLINKDERASASRLPGLGDLPVLGRLFSSQIDDTQRTELILAITPRILRNLHQPDASEAELWVGTEAATRLRPPGGQWLARKTVAPTEATKGASPASPSAAPTASRGPAANDAAAVLATATAEIAPPTPAIPWPADGPADGAPEGGAPDGANAAPSNNVSLRWQAPGEVKAGEEFDVALMLNSAATLRGSPVRLAFDKAALQVITVTEGEYFRQGGAATSFSHSIDAAAGSVRAGVLRTQSVGTPGQGVLVKLRVKALKPGTTSISVAGFSPIGVGEQPPRVASAPPLRIEVK